MRYLGVFILSNRKFTLNLQPTKQKYFRASNGIFGKIEHTKNPGVILSLIDTFCVPILLYGLEAAYINQSSRNSIDYVFNAIFAKIFKIKDKISIESCQFYTDHLPVSQLLDLKTISFLDSIQKQNAGLPFTIMSLIKNNEIENLCCKYVETNWQTFLICLHVLRKLIALNAFENKIKGYQSC